MQNVAAIVANERKAVEHREGERGNREQTHRGYGFPLVAEKDEPTGFRGTRKPFFRKCPNRAGEFSMVAGSSPSRVLSHPREEEIPNFFRCLSSTYRLSKLGASTSGNDLDLSAFLLWKRLFNLPSFDQPKYVVGSIRHQPSNT